MEEIWKDIKGFETKYKISSLGNVYSYYTNNLMNNGRKDYYTLCIDSKNSRHHIYDLMTNNFSELIVNNYKTYINKEKVENLPNEIWKDVPNYEGIYQASNLGRIKALIRKTRTWQVHKEIILKHSFIDRYLKASFHKDGVKKTRMIHRVIAETFIPNPNNFPCVNHINAIRNDNRVENLEWCTHSMNMKHAYKLGNKNQKGSNNNCAKINQGIADNIREYYKNNQHFSQKEIGEMFNLKREHIKDILNFKIWNY